MFKLFIFFLCFVSECTVWGLDCSADNLAKCLTWMEQMSRIEKMAYTEEELQNICHQLHLSFSCVSRYRSNCFTSKQQKIFDQLFSETEVFVNDLCIPGPFQQRYLNHTGCIHEALKDEKICAPEFNEKMALLNFEENNDFNYDIKVHCCALHKYILCQKELLTKSCGEAAAEIHQIIGERISGPQIKLVCSPYETSEYCNNNISE
ncbi:uncharacterized protein LOC111635310 [Centruroides sculpturatus]|uniref:uncharacterized protein LOC111635310 n=1 Tax=Centruroides sculpturatus TaxID=218467 RepID=UPI000C6DF391|nr:uncharacterized protein LOC111635310 [Centruroides sculpturatus]